MTLVWERSHFYKEHFFIAFLDSFLPLELDDKLFNQPAGPQEVNLPVTIVFATVLFTLKYIEKNLEWSFKTVLKVRAPNTSEKF